MQTTPHLLPGQRPGERMCAGRPLITDQTVLNAYLADVACETAPLDLSDLSNLSDGDLRGLKAAWLDRDARLRGDALTVALGRRLGDEMLRRNMDSAGRVFGVVAQARQVAA